MDVVLAGGHGQVAQRAIRLLVARGDWARGLVRNSDHLQDIRELGAEGVNADLETMEPPAIARLIEDADAMIFAAGAGPGSGPERKRTVDYGAAVKLIDACGLAGVGRYLMVSGLGVSFPDRWAEEMRPYWQAKADADQALAESRLEWTIVRPGRLTDEAGTGLVRAEPVIEEGGDTPRDDVAATLLGCLDEPNTIGKAFDLVKGEQPIAAALRAL
jgi:uncharacterized protein YbjT (DUF2867 family)